MRGNRKYKLVDRAAGVPLLVVSRVLRCLTGGRRTGKAPGVRSGDSVLVVKQSALGDTLLLMPVIKSLRETVGPEGRVDMLVTPVNSSLAEVCSWLDDTFLFDPPSAVRRPGRVIGLVRRLRRRRYDLAVDFDQWLRSSALLAVFSGARRTAGFRTRGQQKHFAFDTAVDQEEGIHESLLFERLAVEAGVPRGSVEPYAGFLRNNSLFGTAGPAAKSPSGTVLFHPGCGSHGMQREWPLERYAELGRMLAEDYGVRIEVSGHGEREERLASELARMAEFPLADISGSLSFPELASHLEEVDLVVCGNTGVMHLAAGMGVPVAAIHGPTDSAKWGPLYGAAEGEGRQAARVIAASTGCSPCLFLGHEYGCSGRDCMESVDVGRVYEACAELLGRRRSV